MLVPPKPNNGTHQLAAERHRDPSLDEYVKSLEKLPRLSQRETTQLIFKAQAGDKTSRDRLVECNLRLVVSVAAQFAGRGLPILDLIQEGSIGLMKAVEKFDLDAGTRFSTYAPQWIAKLCSDAVVKQGSLIREPQYIYEQRGRVSRQQRIAESEGRELPDDDLLQLADVTAEELAYIRATPRTIASLDAELGSTSDDGYEPLMLADTLADTTPSLYEQALEHERYETLHQHMRERLTDQEREVIDMRYGFAPVYREHSFTEISYELHITPRQVSKLHDSALDKLRDAYGLNEDGAIPAERDEQSA